MEQVRKDHYSAFYKYLLVCDPFLGAYFLNETQVHYDMHLEPKMLIKKHFPRIEVVLA
jgi:hypothetical protein